MINVFKIGHLALRLFCGASLAFLALSHAGLTGAFQQHSRSRGVFQSTEIFLVDFLLLVLLTIISIWILLGIRTRVVAGFAAVILWVQLLTLAQPDHGYWPLGQTFLGSLFTLLAFSLVLLACLGGGRHSLYARGWRNISL